MLKMRVSKLCENICNTTNILGFYKCAFENKISSLDRSLMTIFLSKNRTCILVRLILI